MYLAVFRDYRSVLARGERGVVHVMASRLDQAKVIFNFIRGIFAEIPFFRGLVTRETSDCFDLANGITIRIGPADYKAVRGHTYIACLADEIGFWLNDETSVNPDSEILGAVRPAMATTHGVLLCASSPHARKGELWRMFDQHYGRDDPDILVWKAPTRSMNPNISEEFVQAQLARDLELNSAEYLCEWRGDLEDFLSLAAIRACVDAGVYERPYQSQFRYWGYTDLSGGSINSSTLSICHREGDMIVEDCHREIKSPHNPEVAVAEFSAVLRSYRLVKVYGDKYASAWPVEKYKQSGIVYDSTVVPPKSEQYLNLLPLVNAQTAKLLDRDRTVYQLAALQRRTSRGGRDSIDHPRNAHDDCANALAGAFYLASTRPSEWRSQLRLLDRIPSPTISSGVGHEPGTGWLGR